MLKSEKQESPDWSIRNGKTFYREKFSTTAQQQELPANQHIRHQPSPQTPKPKRLLTFSDQTQTRQGKSAIRMKLFRQGLEKISPCASRFFFMCPFLIKVDGLFS
ncbi:MAG: hypothetical protein SOY99_08045 [Alloprevotella sp.]|nr:hypothetical protein [Bacteroidales bacterium]MDY3944160.1 hypothetical protein [Alloprevotella sp.]